MTAWITDWISSSHKGESLMYRQSTKSTTFGELFFFIFRCPNNRKKTKKNISGGWEAKGGNGFNYFFLRKNTKKCNDIIDQKHFFFFCWCWKTFWLSGKTLKSFAMIMHPIRSNLRENSARIFIFLMTSLIIMVEISEFLTWAKKFLHKMSK